MNQATGLMSIGRNFTAQAHRLQRDRAAPGERVQHLGRPPPVGLADLIAEPLQIRPVLPSPVQDAADRLLLHLLHRSPVHPPPLDLLHHPPRHSLQDRLALLSVARVRQQRRNQRSPRSRQRPARRPDVKGGDVAVADVLLVDGVEGGLFEGGRRLQSNVYHLWS